MTDVVFVGRERELQQLQKFLALALAGQSQVCFIVGEAGAGKSTLTDEFVRRAQAADPNVVVAVGTCTSQTGSGDPYLPFRQLLAQLTGNVQAKPAQDVAGQRNSVRIKELARVSANALVEISPDLLGLLVPGGALAGRAARVMADRAGVLDQIKTPTKSAKKTEVSTPELDQTKLREQYTAALQTLSKQKPLCLVLEDLHWADSASLDLLFHLSRQLKDCRVLILGTYRPDDVALGRGGAPHPLESIVNEIKRYRGSTVVDVGQAVREEGQAFVNALVDAEPNRLSERFRKELFDKTRGHPLFTVELLRAMQEDGDLTRDEQGRWVESSTIHWDTLPSRVEGVIKTRIDRLSDALCDLLRTASVEGENFTAQVVAQVQHLEERQVLKDLSRELERRHHLVHEEGETRVGRQILSAYEFAHALVQQFLYNDLSKGERRILHGDIARVLEDLYAGQTDAVTVQLAHHYGQAGEDDKAIEYLTRAGTRAHQISAFHEAAGFFMRALELAPEAAAPAGRVGLLLKLGGAYYAWGKFPDAEKPLRECLDLARRIGDAKSEADAQYYLGLISLRSGKRAEAKAYLETSLAAEEKLGDLAKVGGIYCALGGLAARIGELAQAKEHALQGVSILKQVDQGAALANAHNALGSFCQNLQEFPAAEENLRAALAIFQRLRDRVGCSKILINLGNCYHDQGKLAEAAKYHEESLAVQRELSNPDLLAAALANVGEVALEMNDLAKARRCELEALEISDQIGLAPFVLHILYFYARILAQEGRWDQAAELLGVVRAHPQSDHSSKAQVEQFLRGGGFDMTPEALAAALERGSARDLPNVVKELLEVRV